MKTNFQMIRELNKEYDSMPHIRGIVSMKEIYLINEKLCLGEMDILELRSLRDFIVLFFDREKRDGESDFDRMDKVSAFVSVIDNKIFNIGGEV